MLMESHRYAIFFVRVVWKFTCAKKSTKKATDNSVALHKSAVRRGLEPLTPCVTGTYSNQLN